MAEAQPTPEKETRGGEPLGRRKLGTVNGVDLDRMVETVRQIQKQPDLAEFKFRVSNTWDNGGHNFFRVENFYGTGQELKHEKNFELEADEHQVLLGEDRGPNPVEYLLGALSGCLTSAMVYHAASNGIKIESVESWYEGDIDLKGFLGIDPDVKRGYQQIRIGFKVKADTDDLKRLRELMEYSPVFDTVRSPTDVRIDIEAA